MPVHELKGVVEREGDVFVARCWEVGTECCGKTVEEALENLREETWRRLESKPFSAIAEEIWR
jgi:hypothetical protein